MCNEDDVGGRARVTRDEGVGCNVQKTGEPILMIYTSYDVFLCNKLPFEGRGDSICIKIFSGVNFLITINSLMHQFDSPTKDNSGQQATYKKVQTGQVSIRKVKPI